MADELLVLGSSSGTPTGHRFPTAFALTVTGRLFLVDCGAPVSTLLYRYGLDPLDVEGVFLSHWHLDHVANLGMFIAQNHQLNRPKSLKIYGPRGTRGKIDRLLADSFLLRENLRFKLNVTNVKPGKTYKEALLRVSFFQTQHLGNPTLKTHFGRKATACGMVLKGTDWRAVYSGDLASPQELSVVSKGCDLLIHEMAHTSPEAVAEFAAAAKIPHVLITHIGTDFDKSPGKIADVFSKYYGGNLIVAEDGTRVQLSKIRKNQTIEAPPEPASPIKISADHPQAAALSTVFLNTLQQDFFLTSATANQILQAAESLLQPLLAADSVQPGQVRVPLSLLTPSSGSDNSKITVTLTLDAGNEDTTIKAQGGPTALRRKRIIRLYHEARQQGGALTQEDLARLLNVSVRTIRRDLNALGAAGYPVKTLGQMK